MRPDRDDDDGVSTVGQKLATWLGGQLRSPEEVRDAVYLHRGDAAARLSRFWLLLVLAAVIASAGVVGDSTATVIGAMIVAPLMVPILGTVVAVVLADRTNVIRCLALVVTGAAAVVLIAYVLGFFVDG